MAKQTRNQKKISANRLRKRRHFGILSKGHVKYRGIIWQLLHVE